MNKKFKRIVVLKEYGTDLFTFDKFNAFLLNRNFLILSF